MPFTKLLLTFGKLWSEKATVQPIKLTLVLIIIQVILIILITPLLPPLIPVFYSRPWGKDQLSPPSSLVILPLFSLILVILNTLIGAFVQEKNQLAAKIIIWGTVIVSLFNTITLLRLIFILLL